MPTQTLSVRRPVATPAAAAVEYPYSDGRAMAESPRHVDVILYALATLRNRFAHVADVQVGANMNLFYRKATRGRSWCRTCLWDGVWGRFRTPPTGFGRWTGPRTACWKWRRLRTRSGTARRSRRSTRQWE